VIKWVHSKNKTPVLGDVIPVLSTKLKRELTVLRLFFKIELCSAISIKRSRRELSIDVTESRSILKNKVIMRTLVTFQDRPAFSHINGKLSPRPFE